MSASCKFSNNVLTVFIDGDIDHHTSQDIRLAIDGEIAGNMPQTVCLDFSGVSFMDSSGVGLVMGRYKTASLYGGKVKLVNMSRSVRKIMKMSGLEKIVEFEKGE